MAGEVRKITLIPGDGIGPEVAGAARQVIDALKLGFEWEEAIAGAGAVEKYGTPLPEETLESIKRNKVALKGPVTTPVGTGFRSVNVGIRKALDLYANVRPAKTMAGINSRYTGVDLVIFRENTECLYAGIEHMIGEDAAESIRLITRKASRRIAQRAFEFARQTGRRRVTAGHKANILKLTDGLFLEAVREVAANYPEIAYDEVIVDALSLRLVVDPTEFDVLVLPNLFGDIISDLCAGLVGGLGVAPGANLGDDAAVFEAVHGSAPQIAGQNIANPTALILSAALMLEHLGYTAEAARVHQAVTAVISEGKWVTPDLGGTATTTDFTKAVVQNL
ncbi:MAG: isocitrate/isopropylmalate dehydrogenase family protein [Firmicutes bacterium]|nr:isocitrate/isopropylmalate dehydrogenase family protein [Bacillota bacterium]